LRLGGIPWNSKLLLMKNLRISGAFFFLLAGAFG
jgi:hypothetical protein